MAFAFNHWYGAPLLTAPYRLPQTRQPQTLQASYRAIAGLFWSNSRGFLPYAPVELLAVLAIPQFCRRYGRWALFGLLVAATYVGLLTVEGAHPDFSFAGRFMVLLIPLSAVPLLTILSELRGARPVFWLLSIATAFVAIGVVLDPPMSISGLGQPPAPWVTFVELWPSVLSPPNYPDVTAVLAWTAGLLIISGVVYVVGLPRAHRNARTVTT